MREDIPFIVVVVGSMIIGMIIALVLIESDIEQPPPAAPLPAWATDQNDYGPSPPIVGRTVSTGFLSSSTAATVLIVPCRETQ